MDAIPESAIPRAIARYWEQIQLRPSDPRLLQERFQVGHMIAIYWETIARWIVMRATRDAKALNEPLYLVQAADACDPPMPQAMAAKLMNKANPKDTGGMHGMLILHLGMRVRLMEALDIEHGLVKDAEGVVVHMEVNPLDRPSVDAALAVRRQTGR